MNELKTIIKSIIPKEVEQDHEKVETNSFILNPWNVQDVLYANGEPEETIVSYQLVIFFKNKGELIAKTKQLKNALKKYPMDAFSYKYEASGKLWSGITIIRKL